MDPFTVWVGEVALGSAVLAAFLKLWQLSDPDRTGPAATASAVVAPGACWFIAACAAFCAVMLFTLMD